jgi:hypothetical protein
MLRRIVFPGVALLALLSLFMLADATVSVRGAAAGGSTPFRCPGADFYWPVNGSLGWIYREPDAVAIDGHVHTGLDIWASGGDGAPIYALADGYVSRSQNSYSFDIVYYDTDVEVYTTHTHHNLSIGQEVSAGEVIAMTDGEWVHMSVGAFHGYDDRVIGQTQDPSSFFSANVNYANGARNPLPYNEPLSSWCGSGSVAPPPGGDALCDGRKDSLDAVLVLQYTANLISGKPCSHLADVNGDGSVDALDATLILQYTAGLIPYLPI